MALGRHQPVRRIGIIRLGGAGDPVRRYRLVRLDEIAIASNGGGPDGAGAPADAPDVPAAPAERENADDGPDV